MKTKPTNYFLGLLRRFFTASAIVMSFFGLARATDIAWDTVADGTGVTGGAGTWNLADAKWTNDAGATNIAWPNLTDSVAVFGDTGGAVAVGVPINANGMTFGATGYALTGSAITLVGTTPAITATADASIANVLSGSVGLVKAGDGKLTLTGANNYSGGTTINGGTLQIGSSATNPAPGAGAYTINGTNTLRIEYATTTSAGTSLTAPTWANISGTGTLTIHANGIFDYMSSATALPAGFTGTLHASGGRVQLGASSGGGLGGTTKVIVGSGGHIGMWDNGINLPSSVSFEIAGTGYGEGGHEVAIRMANGGGTSTINGPVLLTASVGIGAGGTGVINGVISGGVTAPLSIGSSGNAGIIALAGANTFEGDTTISVGTLRLDNQNALQNSTLSGSAGAVQFNSTVVANAFTLGGLQGTRNLALQNTAAAPITLSVGNNDADTSYGGMLSGAGGLTKVGAGTLTLTGANTFTGLTTIDGGTLLLNPATAGNLNALAGTGTLIKEGAGTLTLSGANSTGFSGDLGVLGGRLVTNGYLEFGAANVIFEDATTFAPAVLDQETNVALAVGTFATPETGATTVDLTSTVITLTSEPTIGSPSKLALATYEGTCRAAELTRSI